MDGGVSGYHKCLQLVSLAEPFLTQKDKETTMKERRIRLLLFFIPPLSSLYN